MKSLTIFLGLAIGAVAGVAATQDATATIEKSKASPVVETKKSQITTVAGTVSAYEPGRTITVLLPNATTVTYAIDASSAIPAKLEKGRKVVIRTITRPGHDLPLVRKVTYTKTITTKTTVD